MFSQILVKIETLNNSSFEGAMRGRPLIRGFEQNFNNNKNLPERV
ncbi:MAG: hypothetical protein AB8U25_06660 [Rickettsiales endosymbiont of Dermacentor nuttalli]